MKKPTLEEVKEHFKDALEIKSVIGERFTGFKNPHLWGESYYVMDDKGRDRLIWDDEDGYAEITKYKDYTTRYSNKGLKNPNAKHYELWNDFEAIDVIKASLTDEEYKGYLKGNILKYKLRDKGQDESDKVKIKDYQNELKNN